VNKSRWAWLKTKKGMVLIAFLLIFTGVAAAAITTPGSPGPDKSDDSKSSEDTSKNDEEASTDQATDEDTDDPEPTPSPAPTTPNPSPTPPPAPTPPPQPQSATITYTDSGFSSGLVVAAGTQLTIRNNSSGTLQFQSNPHPTHDANQELNVGSIAPGGSETITLSNKGTWGYHNHLNDSHTGTIIVE
jgi:hypothetical protein